MTGSRFCRIWIELHQNFSNILRFFTMPEILMRVLFRMHFSDHGERLRLKLFLYSLSHREKMCGLRNFGLGEFGNSRRTEISRTHPNLADSAELRPNSTNLKRTEPNLSNSAELCPIQPNSARTRRTEQKSARYSEFNRIHPASNSAQLCLTQPN